MNENIVDVLIYLYENYLDGETAPPEDESELREELTQAGFPNGEIEKAFQWLDELATHQRMPHYRSAMQHSFRFFADEELRRLDTDSRGLLLFLEQNDILNQDNRELVIERALALDTQQITTDELKWVVLLVLMNQPGQEAAFAHMEDLVYNEVPAYFH